MGSREVSEREERRRATGGGWRVRGGCKCGHAGEVPIKGKIWGFKVKKNDIACARRVRGRIDIAIR